jgi:hypothetical protein
MITMNRSIALFVSGLLAISVVACKKQPRAAAPNQSTDSSGMPAPQSKDDHSQASSGAHGATTELGTQTIGGWTVRASRDGEIVAGKDAPIDAFLSGGTGKIAAVRFWIGAADAAGSVKARAEIEGQPNHWHTHAEVPNPIPAGSKLWVEIEIEDHTTQSGSFDLKM